MKGILLILFVLVVISCNDSKDENLATANVDNYIDGPMQEYDIPGLGLAVIMNGEISHKKYYGYADLENKIPVSGRTLFQLFSTTKIFSAIAIHQLIEQQKIGLDNDLSRYLTDLPESWNGVKIVNLLSHSSGLPDIVRHSEHEETIAKSKVYNDTIQYAPGKKYSYNQTNFWLLDRIVKKATNKSLPEYVIEEQFDGARNATIFEGSSEHTAKNRATNYYGYSEEGVLKKDEYVYPEYLLSAAGQIITLDGFIAWNEKFDTTMLINDSSKSRLYKKFEFEQPANHAHGWRIRVLNNYKSYGFKAGSFTGFRKFPSKNLTIIFLNNGFGKRFDIEETIDQIAGLFDHELANNANTMQK